MYLGTSLMANAQAMTLVREVIAPIDNLMLDNGYYMSVYDFHIAPNKQPKDMLRLKKSPKSMVQKMVLRTDLNTKGAGSYTYEVTYNANGNIDRVIMPEQTIGGIKNYEQKAIVDYMDNRIGTMALFTKIETMDGVQDRADQTQYAYDAEWRLTKEIFNMYTPGTDGKWHKEENFADQVDFAYSYDSKGMLSSAKVNALEGTVFYNSKGLLSHIVENGINTFQYTYDADDHIITATSQITQDDYNGPAYFKTVKSFVRNAQGDITKVTETRNKCNRRWVITRKGTPITYSIAYTYDAEGNWTKATITKGKALIATLTRSFTY